MSTTSILEKRTNNGQVVTATAAAAAAAPTVQCLVCTNDMISPQDYFAARKADRKHTPEFCEVRVNTNMYCCGHGSICDKCARGITVKVKAKAINKRARIKDEAAAEAKGEDEAESEAKDESEGKAEAKAEDEDEGKAEAKDESEGKDEDSEDSEDEDSEDSEDEDEDEDDVSDELCPFCEDVMTLEIRHQESLNTKSRLYACFRANTLPEIRADPCTGNCAVCPGDTDNKRRQRQYSRVHSFLDMLIEDHKSYAEIPEECTEILQQLVATNLARADEVCVQIPNAVMDDLLSGGIDYVLQKRNTYRADQLEFM